MLPTFHCFIVSHFLLTAVMFASTTTYVYLLYCHIFMLHTYPCDDLCRFFGRTASSFLTNVSMIFYLYHNHAAYFISHIIKSYTFITLDYSILMRKYVKERGLMYCFYQLQCLYCLIIYPGHLIRLYCFSHMLLGRELLIQPIEWKNSWEDWSYEITWIAGPLTEQLFWWNPNKLVRFDLFKRLRPVI